MKLPKKKIKLEIKRYHSLVAEFEDNEKANFVSLKSRGMFNFLGEFINLDSKKDLETLIERNDFIEFLMPYRFTQEIEQYLLAELPFPFPTTGYKDRFIKIARNIDENIKEINILKKRNLENIYLNEIHQSLIIILVNEALETEQNPKELYLSLMKEYSQLYNKENFVLGIENLQKSGYFKSPKQEGMFEKLHNKAKEVAFCWSYNEECILLSLNYNNGAFLKNNSSKKINEKLDEFIDH